MIFLIVATRAGAQTPFLTMDSISINNISAQVLVHGDMFWDPATYEPRCRFPKGAPTNINFVSALWMSGYDGGGQLHVAAQTYRQDGNDYWPGPLDATGKLSYATSASWAKIWKVNRTDVNYFMYLATHTIANTPPAILTWPAKGNIYATGNSGAPLAITTDMAPFVDLNHNSIYEPLMGEYPDFPGDQALWWTFSDNGPSHSQSNGKPIGVEIHAMAYAYKRGTLIDNVIYYDYKAVNKSPNSYTNFRIGLFDDVDLGYAFDDYIGYDSVHRMGLAYNGSSDDGLSGGHPANSFGTKIPIVGVSMIILPGDDLTTHTHVPAGSFMYYNNDASPYGNPSADTEYNNYLRSSFRTGGHLVNDFAGPGTMSAGYGSGPRADYAFPGDPSDSTKWSECVSGNLAADRRFIITSNDFTLPAGGTQEVVMALMTTDPAFNNACPSNGFSGIKETADTAWNIFYNPPPPLPLAIDNLAPGNNLRIYPNPAHDKLYVTNGLLVNGEEHISIYNIVGQLMNVPMENNGGRTTVDVSPLPAGCYHITYRNGTGITTARFVKE